MEDVEYFLPSEIARLVYGHLKKMGCHEISEKFLHSSPHLSECREIQKNNRTFKTEANGLPLKEILDQYLNMSRLILSAVNVVTADPKKFTDPIAALKFILKLDDMDTEDEVDPVVDANPDSPDNSDSSNDEVFSDISLNINPTPNKRRVLRKPQPKKLESITESPVVSDISQPDCRETNSLNPISNTTAQSTVPRKSTRILNKRASNDKCSNSDGIKDVRKNVPDVVETPCKLGQPPYSESKIHKPKTGINLLFESEPEPELEHPEVTEPPILSIDDYYFSKDYVPKYSNHSKIRSLFSSPESKTNSPMKKTIKTLKPRRPLSACSKTPESTQCQKERIKCKRNRTLPVICRSDKKTKLCSPVELEGNSKSVSNEPVPVVDTLKVEKPKNRRKSSNIENDEERTLLKQNKLNKSLSMIDNETPVDVSVLKETLIDSHYKKLHERLAASINKVIINSPQKINTAGTEELDNAIQKVIHDAETDPMFDEILQTLLRDTFSVEEENEIKQNCNITPQKENSETSSILIYNEAQNETDLNRNNSEISHNDLSPNSIVTDLNQEKTTQELHQRANFERPLPIAEDIRNYVSYTADVSSSPDRENLELRNQEHVKNYTNASHVKNTEVRQSEQVIIAPHNATLFPLGNGLPMLMNKPAELQIYGTLSQFYKPKMYVPIAPKTELMEGYSNEVQRVTVTTNKRRVRSVKRG